MTTIPARSTATDPDLARQAIDTLTAIARQTRVRGEGTPHAATEPVDFADLAAFILTSVAANLGSVETLLAGRSGSWEADLVRQLVCGTAGYDDGDLLGWRTEPVRLTFVAEDTFDDLGITELVDDEVEQAYERSEDESLTAEQRQAADELGEAMRALFEQDVAAYAAAYRASAEQYLTERGATCGVDLVPDVPNPYRWDELAEQVQEHARAHTPLPMTGTVPDWSRGATVDALRRAGLTYSARAGAPRA